MSNDNVPSHLRVRKQLADFAKRAGTTPDVASKVAVIRGQLCAYQRALPSVQPTLARIIERSMADLKALSAQ